MNINYQNIINLADGDLSYQKELTLLYIDFLEEFSQHYRKTMERRDLNALRAFAHKAKPSITFLELENLGKELEAMKQLFVEKALTNKKVQESIQQVEQACQEYQRLLRNFSQSY